MRRQYGFTSWPWSLLIMLALLAAIPVETRAWDATTAASTVTAATVNTTTTATTTTTIDCSLCHQGTTLENHHSTGYFTNGQCNYCHGAVTTTGDCNSCHALGLTNKHHASTFSSAGNCEQCHNNVGDYTTCFNCHYGKTRTRHHDFAKAMGFTCKQCHSTIVQQTPGDCGACHTTPVRQRHHNLGQSCSSCHTAYVPPPQGCKSLGCHQASTGDAHHLQTNPAFTTCFGCHPFVWDPLTSSYKTQLPTVTDCQSCHETRVQPGVPIGDVHHATLTALNNPCSACHQGISPVPTCTSCHGTDPVTIHHSSQLYQQGVCLVCHVGADAQNVPCATCHADPPHHLQPQAYAGDCAYCHTTIVNDGASCSLCHTAPIADTHHGPPLDSVGGDCSVCHESVSNPTTCANCHAANPHHTTAMSTGGDCAYCHKVPAAAADRPMQAACRECHGTNTHDKGGPIQDYGACAACHNTTPFHPKPASIPGYTGYGAGKKKFNLFWALYAKEEGPGENLSPNGDDMNDEGGLKIKSQQLTFNKVQISHAGQTYTVPSFDATAPVSLTTCTRCHAGKSSLVSCTNTKWLDHRTQNRVDLATYQLAETTYLGSLCTSAASGSSCTVVTTGTYLEAESYTGLGTNFSVQSSTSANGGRYLKATVTSTSATSGTPANFVLKFPETGTYYLWFRGNDQRNSAYNSLWYGLDGTRVGDIQTPATDSNWRWVNARAANGPSVAAITITTTGSHTLNVWAREANFQLDGIYLTKANTTIPGGTTGTIPTGATVINPAECTTTTAVTISGGTSTTTTTGNTTGTTTTTTPTNLALNKFASATRYESGYEASKAVDGSTSSYWWAKSTSTHSIKIDLGNSTSIAKVSIAWGSYYAKSYQVEVSADGSSWTQVASTTSGNGGTPEHNFTARTARYVRVVCSNASSSNGYVIKELSVFASSTTTTIPTNLALNKTASATRYESGYEAAKAVDGSTSSYWWAKSTSTHSIKVDLGSSTSIAKVSIAWGSYYAKSYQVEVSTDGSNWTQVASTTSGSGGTPEHSFTARTVRYVRVVCSNASSSNGYVIKELSVFQ
ncbi:MAG: hypothetical protein FIB02_07125 [Desulfuromonas sp.]|nr:hypothetical protein [Desulfuromonas sp.]